MTNIEKRINNFFIAKEFTDIRQISCHLKKLHHAILGLVRYEIKKRDKALIVPLKVLKRISCRRSAGPESIHESI
jgi:hypothetical protein